MIKVIILYYLSIKPTHGYEIQKFIQMSGTEQWMKIQSGSIYYALTKLEKEKCISVLREERTGSRVRKIYEITKLGEKQLHSELINELQAPITEVGSPKFIIESLLNILSKKELESILHKHIEQLKEQKEYWRKWSIIKAGSESTKLVQLSFSMTLHSLEDQIAWHQELLDNIELYRNQSTVMKDCILQFDADGIEDNKVSDVDQKINYITKIKDIIENDPSKAIDNLDLILEELKKQKQS